MPGTRRKGQDARRLFAGAAVLFLLTAAVFLPALKAGYIWDDDTFLTENPLILRDDGLRGFWFSTEPPDYFPLTSTMLWIEWRLWRGSPAGFHAVNILLHAASAVFLWFVLRRLKVPGAWAGALLFGIHPVAVETVAWITERKNTLPMMFSMAAVICFLRADDNGRRRDYALSVFLFLLALLSKTSVVMLPFVLLLCAWRRRGRVNRRDLTRTLPFFALSFILGCVTVWYQAHSAIGGDVIRTDGFASRLAVAGQAVWFYLYKAAVPLRLCFVYDFPLPAPLTALSYLPLAALAGLCVVLWRMRRGPARGVLFALTCYVLMLAPALGFVNIYFMKYSVVSDHWQYFSLPAFTALIAAGWARLQEKAGRRGAVIFPAAAAALFLLLAALSWRQTLVYRDSETLWRHTLSLNSGSGLAHNNLGRILRERGAAQEATGHFRKALEAFPGDVFVLQNLAAAVHDLGRPEEAERYYREALEVMPESVLARTGLGRALADLGALPEAEACFREAIAQAPAHGEAWAGLGLVSARKGCLQEAREYLEKALALGEDTAAAHGNLANVLAETGLYDEALVHYRKALEREPGNEAIRRNMGIAQRRASERR